MSEARMPSGRYLSTPLDIGVEYGGQTRATLVRNRLFAERFGLRPEVLTFNPRPSWHTRVAALRHSGLLLPDTPVHNLYDAYAATDWREEEETPPEQPPLLRTGMQRATELRPDGSPWRHVHTGSDGDVVHEYLRADGSPWLRIPRFAYRYARTWPSSIERVGPDGKPRGAFPGFGAWVRHWLADLSQGERTFVFVDSRSLAVHLLPMRTRHLHTVFVVHGVHLQPPYHWSSTLERESRHVLRHLDAMDAVVSQTDRQRRDLALRFGEAPQLLVAPNAVDAPPEPAAVRREPHRLVTVCRLMPGKRLLDAVEVADRVRRVLPGVRLDMYGEGPERPALEAAIAQRGLDGVVTLHGHDPAAREQLWSATASLMTSESETWNMSLQESMSHGCPVVGYDIKYGPREQITDGVDGLLVPDGDVAAMAEAALRLLQDPQEAGRLGAAARAATTDSVARFEHDWVEVMRAAVRNRARRVRAGRVVARTTGLRVVRWRRGEDATGAGLLLRRRGRGRIELQVEAQVPTRTPELLHEARWQLLALAAETEEAVELPLEVERDGDAFTLRSRFRESLGALPGTGPVELRLGLVWRNVVWTRYVAVPDGGETGDPDAPDRVRLLRGGAAQA